MGGAPGSSRIRPSGATRRRAPAPVREYLRDTFWFAPAAGLVGAALLAWLTTAADAWLVSALRHEGDLDAVKRLISVADDSRSIVTTVGAAMLTFIGVVFSISLVALQMAGQQFSPRVVRLYVRSRITKCTFSVFLATFLFCLLVQSSYDSDTNPATVGTVPFLSSLCAVLLVMVSLVLFVAYVNSTLRLTRVSHIIDRIARESFRAARAHAFGRPGDAPLPEAVGVIAYRGRAGVVRDVNAARLVRVARRYGTVLRLEPRAGDFVVPGTPLLTAHGGTVPPARSLRRAVFVGVERTYREDLGFGLRQLADIALRASSPAIQDPTTAVQAVDRITHLLATLAERPLGAVHHRDRTGVVRLVRNVPDWPDLVDLGLAEVRIAAVGNPQVTRRLVAALDDLTRLAPAGRRAPLERHRALLARAVERAVPEPAERDFALRPDRQGIG
ncbi:DUF2254 domain-containing protein [Streptantibioticus parmotrematis]|uniref:DUF2254 domain-containing protein n=1 Tax=Streptantibioticus parmotrematis TaxID=2873249 RepID=UPI0033D1F575